jgi:hypothetical protein
VPEQAGESERLLAETRALDVLEAELAADLDFGGLSTSQVHFSASWPQIPWALC